MNTDKFYKLHLDEKFEILETKGVHHKFLVRCKNCNEEHWHDDGILRKPNVNVMYCPCCKNTNFVSKAKQHIKKGTPEFVEQIASMYSSGIEQKEIVETTGQTYNVVRYWLKKRGLYDPARRGHNTKGNAEYNEKQRSDSEKRIRCKAELFGFEYIGGYKTNDSKVTLICKECNETFERAVYTIRNSNTINCPRCQQRKRETRQLAKEIDKEARALARQQAEIERKSRKVEAKERFFNEPHICKECGRTFSYRTYCMIEGVPEDNISKVVFCSNRCRRRHNSRLHSRGKHIRRAKKYGVEYDWSITLEKLIEKKGLSCSICGLTCFYSGDSNADLYPSIDHIIPLSRGGGHTWENVQVAHRICNTIKNDQVGKEWNNGN